MTKRAPLVININMNNKCAECAKGGAVQNGLCLSCTTKAMRDQPMKSWQGQAVQARMAAMVSAIKGKR
jgi:hypothetical protein